MSLERKQKFGKTRWEKWFSKRVYRSPRQSEMERIVTTNGEQTDGFSDDSRRTVKECGSIQLLFSCSHTPCLYTASLSICTHISFGVGSCADMNQSCQTSVLHNNISIIYCYSMRKSPSLINEISKSKHGYTKTFSPV